MTKQQDHSRAMPLARPLPKRDQSTVLISITCKISPSAQGSAFSDTATDVRQMEKVYEENAP